MIALPSITGHSSTKIHTAGPENYDAIVDVWEQSVRATHDFVTPEDIDRLKPIIRDKMLPDANVVYMKDDEDRISGFAGIVGDKIEMLFVSPAYFGKGIGKRLFWHAVCEMHADRLDVNESNVAAVNFYMRQGCKVIGRSPVDGMGNPYPILHLQWASSA